MWQKAQASSLKGDKTPKDQSKVAARVASHWPATEAEALWHLNSRSTPESSVLVVRMPEAEAEVPPRAVNSQSATMEIEGYFIAQNSRLKLTTSQPMINLCQVPP
jgi:hypothetical protein